MKFEKALEKVADSPQPILKQNKIIEPVADYKMYGNVAVYSMKPGQKGNFKSLSSLANDGEVVASWSIRLSLINGEWIVHIAPHPNLTIEINMEEKIKNLLSDIECYIQGHLRLGIIKPRTKKATEDIINLLIGEFSTVRLDGIEKEELSPRYSIKSTKTKFKIPSFFQYTDEFDSATYQKYLIIIKTLSTKELEKEDENHLIKISKRLVSNRVVPKSDLTIINNLSDKYIKQNEKIKIAMKYMLT